MGPCTAQHGFARNSTFEIAASTADSVRMVLCSPPGGMSSEFPAGPFELHIVVTIADDGTLTQEMIVKNTAEPGKEDTTPYTAPLKFTAALHTYFRLYHGIASAEIQGLKGVRFLDSLQARKECIEENDCITFPGEVDRIYCGAHDKMEIVDGSEAQHEGGEKKGRRVMVSKTGFRDVVVWNPAAEKAQRMKDFGDDEWRDMVCLEVAQAGSGAVEVAPGKEWVGKQILKITSS